MGSNSDKTAVNGAADGSGDDAESVSSTPSASSSKSWITRGLGAIMQLPKKTPLSALYWTTPEGPMPQIFHMPSRDGPQRMIEVYVWIPPANSEEAALTTEAAEASKKRRPKLSSRVSAKAMSMKAKAEGAEPPQVIEPSFQGKKRPCLIDFHGGGFVMGGPLEEAPWCAALARSGIITISVAYRLGPTYEFPAALHDAEDAVRAVLDETRTTQAGHMLREHIHNNSGSRALEIDTSRVALSGFSSGGNVALNMLLDIPGSMVAGGSKDSEKQDADWPSPFTRERAAQIPALLFFPSLDARKAPHERTRPPGMAPAGGISKFMGRNLVNAYLPANKVGHLRASPGLAPLGPGKDASSSAELKSDAERQKAAQQAADSAAAEAKKSHHEEVPDNTEASVTPHARYDAMLKGTRALLILPEIDTLAEQSEVWARALDASGKLREGVAIDGTVFGDDERIAELKQKAASKDVTEAKTAAETLAQYKQERQTRQDEERAAGAALSEPLDLSTSDAAQTHALVRVHRVKGMSHGFVTYPDSFLDLRTRAVKALVMEQARRWTISMLGGTP